MINASVMMIPSFRVAPNDPQSSLTTVACFAIQVCSSYNLPTPYEPAHLATQRISDREKPMTASSQTETNETNQGKERLPLRIWPAVILLITMVVLRFLPSMTENLPDFFPIVSAMAPIVCSLLLLIWWLAASRASWRERLLGISLMLVAGLLAHFLADSSMQGAATMLLWTVPMGFAGFALGLALVGGSLSGKRTCLALWLACIGLGATALLRSEGMWGHAKMDLYWRWTESAEEKLLAKRSAPSEPDNVNIEESVIELALANPEWPGFRGPERNSRQSGPVIDANWNTHPPELLWKIPVGPAWSSFAVANNLLFTQEQRGTNECVVCYDASSGNEIWFQKIEARFSDPLGGPGPRATPQLANGKLYVLGGNGDLLCLEAKDGGIQWQKNIGSIAERKAPTWGFSSSPLVISQVVIVHAGGQGNLGTLAFDRETGDLAWASPGGDHSYGSPQAIKIEDATMVMMLTNKGLTILEPTTGTVQLDYEWKQSGYRALQPQSVGDNSILIASEMNRGARRIQLERSGESLSASELWTSRNLKSDFNDFVVYQDSIYGFDGGMFACVDLKTGERRWKGGRYGKGQVLLLESSGLLLVAGERGQGVLLKATPEDLTELTTIQLLTGKTWNHPVVVGDRLYIRNAQEAACYRLPLAQEQETTNPRPLSEE